MKLMVIAVSFVFVVHVSARAQRYTEDNQYENNEEEEDDEEGTESTTIPVTTTTAVRPAVNFVITNSTAATPAATPAAQNYSFVLKPSDNSFFGAVIQSSAGTAASTERAHYVLGQVGNIWNNVGSLNITGIVDQALGIRNSQIARPIVTSILNAVFCNPFTFSNNNCNNKRG